MTPASDMADTTPMPAPTTMHVGATGTTCCLVSDCREQDVAAYLLNPGGRSASVYDPASSCRTAGGTVV